MGCHALHQSGPFGGGVHDTLYSNGMQGLRVYMVMRQSYGELLVQQCANWGRGYETSKAIQEIAVYNLDSKLGDQLLPLPESLILR